MSPAAPRRPLRRRLGAVLAAALLVLVGGHGGLWWWVTGQMEQQVAATIAQPQPGWNASAGVLRRGGWPWAATVEVPLLVVQAPLAPGETLGWQAERLVVALELARPRTLLLSAEGAQRLRMGVAPPIPFSAARMRAEVPLEPGVPVRGGKLEIARLEAETPSGRFALGRLDLSAESRPAAQQGEPAVAVVADAAGIALPPGQDWPLGPAIAKLGFDVVVTGPVPRNPDLGDRAAAWRDGGGAIELRRLDLAWGEVTVGGGATLALDGQLQPMGAATARVAGHGAALRALSAAGVLTPRSAVAAGAVLALMARPPAEGGAPVVEVPFSLQNRTLALGRIPLLRLPELVWRAPP